MNGTINKTGKSNKKDPKEGRKNYFSKKSLKLGDLRAQKKVKEIVNKYKEVKNEEDIDPVLSYHFELDEEDALKESDFFELKKDEKITTILNSEEAAISKCKQLWNDTNIKEGLWVDPDFGMSEDKPDLHIHSIYGTESIPKEAPRPSIIEWYPLTRLSQDAKFFHEGVESNDVIQGCLSDGWFISALSLLATKDYLIRGEYNEQILEHILNDNKIDEEENSMLSTGVYPPIFHSFRYKGIFCFKFFKDFSWRYVIVDNRLPCLYVMDERQTPTLLYGRCRSEKEFWVPLIEKAYAKLHGSYRALIGGFIDEGLMDLTGLIPMYIVLKKNDEDQKSIDELWNKLIEYTKENLGELNLKTKSEKKVTSKFFTRNKTLMGCAVDPTEKEEIKEVKYKGKNSGILTGLGYSILDVFELEIKDDKNKNNVKKVKLLRLRNPWGRKEWSGPWSDDSNESKKYKHLLEDHLKKKYEGTSEKINIKDEDGIFLMNFDDFRKIFDKIYLCSDLSPTFLGIRIHGEWTENENGPIPTNKSSAETSENFCKNPQYYLLHRKRGKVIICLVQKDGRLTNIPYPYKDYVYQAGIIVFQTDSEKKISGKSKFVGKSRVIQRRQISLELFLEEGKYIIVPSTLEGNKYGKFCLEFYFEDEVTESHKNISFKNNYICKVGDKNKTEFEIIWEFNPLEAEKASDKKEKFLKKELKHVLKNDDTYNYNINVKPIKEDKKEEEIKEDDEDQDNIEENDDKNDKNDNV